MVVAFFAISLYSGFAAYENLQLQNSSDAGIITQAVASTSFGRAAPFYESYDCLVKSRCSFLLVHPAFVLYGAVPFYRLAPSTVTLFALRSALVATAALPLYWLTRQVTGSPGKGLLAAGMFLVWAPSFVGDAFSLHLESLFPLELFSLAALWQAGRYRSGLAVAGAAFLTFEVAPLFTFLVGVFFLSPYVERGLSSLSHRRRSGDRVRISARARISGWVNTIRGGWRTRELRYLLVLMASSILAFVALSLFINVWGCEILGVACPSISPGIAGSFQNPSSSPVVTLGTLLQSAQTITSVEYWLILYALVAFIPLLSPRALLLSVPWIGYTLLTDSSRFTTLGHQYSLIAAAPIFIGLAYGLRRVNLGPHVSVRGAETPGRGDTRTSASLRVPGASPGHRQVMAITWTGVLCAVVVVNGLLAPINPVLSDLGVTAGAPFESGYFHHSLAISPGFEWVQHLLSTVPSNASLAVVTSLYALSANYPHAYLVQPGHTNTSNLPFSVAGGPQYALLFASSLGKDNLGPALRENLSNPLLYGLRGYVASSTQGPVLLYEAGNSQPAELFGPQMTRTVGNYLPGSGLAAGPKGVQAVNSSSPSGSVIESSGAVKGTGLVWTGPTVTVAPGSYTLSFEVEANGANITAHPGRAAMRIAAEGFGGIALNQTLTDSQFIPGTWTRITFNISLENPIPNLNFDGFLEDSQLSIAVASVSLWPIGP
ncbi:MAG: DUF2079 domain-containing protein [Thermoplasmata archaeon]